MLIYHPTEIRDFQQGSFFGASGALKIGGTIGFIMTTLEKTLLWIARAGVFLLPFVPLLVSTSLFFPYITGKNFAFRIIVEIMAGAWLALALVNPVYRPKKSWILGAMAIFVFIIAIADAMGVNAFKSFWSNYERMDGWVTIAHLLVYTVVAASVMQGAKIWRWLFWESLAVSVYLSVYGVLQVAGVSALGLGGAAGLSARIDATFGNPIYMAAYMLFHIFIAAMLWSQMWVERGRGERLPMSLAYGAIILFDSLALLFTGTRGTTIGLVGGALLTALLLLIMARNSRNAWRASAGAVVALVVLVGGFYMVRNQQWVQNVGFMKRLATISTQDATVKARFINWSIAWNGVQERPLLGWGQENYAIVFDKYYDARMYAQEPWFDRVHNIVFDWLIAGGFLGLISYLSIFGAALFTLWRRVYGFTIAEKSIITGLLAGYFAHNFFVFDNVTSYILFGTVLAYLVSRASEASGTESVAAKTELFSRRALPYVALVCALITWGTAWGVNSAALAANRALLQAVAPQGDIEKNLAFIKEAISYGSYGTQEAREQLSQQAMQVAASASVSNDTKQHYFDTAISEMKLQEQASPLDARFPLFTGLIYAAYGQYDIAAASLQQAHELSPAKQSIYYQIGQNDFVRGDIPAGVAAYKAAFDLLPENTSARASYAAALIRAGSFALADEVLKPLIESGQAADQRILAAYDAQSRLDKAIPLWEAHIAARPDDVQAYFTLAAIFYTLNDSARAIAVLQSCAKANPAAALQVQSVIEQIRNGTATLE